MTIKELEKCWINNKRHLWYAYIGLFAPVKLWKRIQEYKEDTRNFLVDSMISHEQLIMLAVPISAVLYCDPEGPNMIPTFSVYWDPFVPDICGIGCNGARLDIANNYQNCFQEYKDCVKYCQTVNPKVLDTSNYSDSTLLSLITDLYK